MQTFVARNLRLSYGANDILKDIDLDMKGGEFTALLGCNGAGKSSLLKVLSGDLKAAAGEVTLFNTPLARYTAKVLAKHRAVLTQKPSLSFSFRVHQVIEMGAANKNMNRTQQRALVSTMIRLTGLEDLCHRDYNSCSGGEQQRVHFARILAQLWSTPTTSHNKPPVLLLDEPVSALDLAWQQRVLEIAQWLSKSKGWSVLAVLHDMNQAAAYADHVFLLENGRCLDYGTPRHTLTNTNLNKAFGVIAHVQPHPLAPERPQIVPIKADLPDIERLV